MRTKIVIFLIISGGLTLFSCSENTKMLSPIPYVRVNFSLNILNIPELQIPLSAKYIANTTGKKVGYKGHGIYIIKINDTEFRAFDASCTYSYQNTSDAELSTHLEMGKKQKILVFCPKCKSKFSLVDGSVQSGVARFPLKEYRTRFSGNTLRVFN